MGSELPNNAAETSTEETVDLAAVEPAESVSEAPSVETPEPSDAPTADPNEAPAGGLDIESIKPKMKVTGTVTRVELQGAVVDIQGLRGLLHISQLSEEPVKNVS
ncbi:MAG: S1 RNA-binding domain-containing protein [Anaerolineae bacterium]|nr:S1 RNA-binding domain-containing protein [Anaerolineae bacterium]